MRWDIHDDALKTEQHVAGECPTGLPTVTVDAVDNCRGPRDVAGYDADFGPFSRVFGDRVNGAEGQGAGPFDPLRPQTLLSDGKLDAGDAPMPAARVDVEIAPNTAGGINGAGQLQKSDKTEVYSRDGNGTATPHNLYAPYYKQWLPGTAVDALNPAPVGDGLVRTRNNFPFVPVTLYDNWDAYSWTTGRPWAPRATGSWRSPAGRPRRAAHDAGRRSGGGQRQRAARRRGDGRAR